MTAGLGRATVGLAASRRPWCLMSAVLLAIFGTSFVVGLTGALTPGPLFTMTVREALRRGFWAGPLLAVGHALIELALVVALAFGLNQVLDEGPVTAAVALAGGLVLVWMGQQIVRTAPRQVLEVQPQLALAVAGPGAPIAGAVRGGAPGPWGLPFASLVPAGALVSASNPYWVIWWATVGAAYVSKSLEYGAAGISAFYGGHILSDLAWLALVAFVLASGRRLMSRRAYQGVLLACGLFLVVLGGWFVLSGVNFLR